MLPPKKWTLLKCPILKNFLYYRKIFVTMKIKGPITLKLSSKKPPFFKNQKIMVTTCATLAGFCVFFVK